MNNETRKGAVGALLDEYEKSIKELQYVIDDISPTNLAIIVDNKTADANCKSIQTILAHVVSSGYSYASYICELKKMQPKRKEKVLRPSVEEYKNEFDDFFKFTCDTFENITDEELEEFDEAKKMKTSWNQFYDIEQIMEHAIVHILRHRRQIEKFKMTLDNNS